jgi:LacI family transcriptional regulator
LDLSRSVLDYGEHVGHWQFVGQDNTPFTDLAHLDAEKVDGVIGSFLNQQEAAVVRGCGLAAVNVSSLTKIPSLPSVTCDNRLVGRMGAEHLLGLGFAVFGYAGYLTVGEAQEQMAGFTDTIKGTGCVCHLQDLEADAESEQILAQLRAWLDEVPKPIAIMAESDAAACATLNAALNLQLRVPDDVAVLGVGNNPFSAIRALVSLSSIEVNHRSIGQRAAVVLEGLMSGEAPPPPQSIPPLGVVTRRSTDVVVSEDPVVAKVLRYIREHVADGIGVQAVLERVDMSRETLDKRLRHATGQTAYGVICRMRVEQAKHMLLKTDASIDQIARACGFRRQARLNEVFKRLTGMTPGQYRQQRSRR